MKKVMILLLITFLLPISAEKTRIIVETDLGGDTDDQASLVRFLLYSNDFDVEGIILSRSNADFQNDGAASNPSGATTTYEMATDYLDAYGAIYANLRVHDANYPSVSFLKGITKSGHNTTTDGENLIISALQRTDSRPIWYTNWGCNDPSTSSLKRVLDKIQAGTVSGLTYSSVINKLRYVEESGQNHIGSTHRSNLPFYMDTFYPDMDGGRWYHRWAPLTGIATWLHANAGSTLCNQYYTTEKEGDSPVFMHLLPNGINVIGKPFWGSWSGRFGWNSTTKMWWCDRRDAYNGTTNRDNTLIRWGGGSQAAAIMNDFKARAKWCDYSSYSQGNHPPVPAVNGSVGYEPVYIDAAAGKAVTLNASASTDPDGNSLAYKWVHYREISTYAGAVTITNSTSASAALTLPADFLKGDTVHLYAAVTDNGTPNLTRYKRVIIINTGAVTGDTTIPSGFRVTLVSYFGSATAPAIVQNGFVEGATQCNDRTGPPVYTNIPALLSGLTYLLTARDDRGGSVSETGALYRVNASAACTVFAVLDNDGGTPSWIAVDGWSNSGLTVTASGSVCSVYRKYFASGNIDLKRQVATTSEGTGYVFKLSQATTAIHSRSGVAGQELRLDAHPNPFNPTVTISVFGWAFRGIASQIAIFDINGRCVADLSARVKADAVVWNASGFQSGIYLVKLTQGAVTLVKRITLVK